jgi:hypothetical protein
MNKVYGAIPNLTNAMRVYAALDLQSAVKGKVVDAGVNFTSSNPVQWETHGITFKRISDNHLIRIYLSVERGESSCEDERYGAPSIRFHAAATHEADQLLCAVVSLFGGAIQVRPEDSNSADYPWEDISRTDQAWAQRVPAGRAAQIRLIDNMPGHGLELLKILGPACPDALLEFRAMLASDAVPLTEWNGADK